MIALFTYFSKWTKKRKEKKNPGGVFYASCFYCFESFPKTCPPINAKISFGMKDHFTMSPKMKTKEKSSGVGVLFNMQL